VTGGSCYVRTRGSEGLSGVRAEMRQADVNSRLVSKHQHISQKIAFLVSSTSYLIAMSEMDLSLPDTVPDMAQFDNRPMTLDSFALYNLVDTEDEPSGLVEESQSDCPRDDYVRFRKAPGVNSLRSLIEFHLNTTVQDAFDPNFFLVVTDPDWRHNGLTVVTLGDDEGKPDKFVLKTADSGILLVNLQIGNTDWYEAKENYELVGQDDTADTEPGT
jgi:hypothetical protein